MHKWGTITERRARTGFFSLGPSVTNSKHCDKDSESGTAAIHLDKNKVFNIKLRENRHGSSLKQVKDFFSFF